MEKDETMNGAAIQAEDRCPLALRDDGYLVSGMAVGTVGAIVASLIQAAATHGQAAIDPARTEKAIHDDLRRVREGLEGSNPTPLERLLAERVVVCYAAIATLECRSDHNPAGATEAGWKRTERLYRRLNESAKALAAVQKMRLPSSPMYVGGQHVHLGGG